MRRVLTWLAGGLGAAAVVRQLLRRHPAPARPSPGPTTVDPAEELRARLEQARGTADDRDEFDAAEGTPVDEVERPSSLEERRRRVHDKAQEALGEMRGRDES
jgi:hypothetical protein